MNLKDYKLIAPKINADLEALFAKHGFKVSKLRVGIDELAGENRYTITTTETNLKTASGEPTTPEAERYKRNCALIGLKPEWLGRQIKASHGSYKLTGLRDTRSERCVILEKDGRNYVQTPAIVARLMERA